MGLGRGEVEMSDMSGWKIWELYMIITVRLD
jgi:hypothetical protein